MSQEISCKSITTDSRQSLGISSHVQIDLSFVNSGTDTSPQSWKTNGNRQSGLAVLSFKKIYLPPHLHFGWRTGIHSNRFICKHKRKAHCNGGQTKLLPNEFCPTLRRMNQWAVTSLHHFTYIWLSRVSISNHLAQFATVSDSPNFSFPIFLSTTVRGHALGCRSIDVSGICAPHFMCHYGDGSEGI